MGFIADKPVTLAGKEYQVGEAVPDDVVDHPAGLGGARMEGLGLIRRVPDADPEKVTSELEQVRAELAAAHDRIEELDNELAEAREALETLTAPDETPAPEPGDDRVPVTKPVDPEAPAPAPEPPPQGGAGSELSAWRDYAAQVGVTVPEGATRGDIIDAIEAAGLPT